MTLRLRCLLLGVGVQALTSCAQPGPTPTPIHEAIVNIAPSTGEAVGMVVDSATGEPLCHALVIANRTDVPADSGHAAADCFGVFHLRQLPAGLYHLKALYIAYTPRVIDISLPLPPHTILLLALRPRPCTQSIDLIVCPPIDTMAAIVHRDSLMSKARRILGWWHGDAVFIAPNGSIPNEDSVVTGIRDSLGSDAAGVLLDIVRGRDPTGFNVIAATVYARLGLPPQPLQEILNSADLHDDWGAGIASAAFRGLRELETRSVSVARAAYVRRAATFIVTDSAPKGLGRELEGAILGLKVERNTGSDAARELLESPEVQLAMKWLVAHGYEVGR